MSALHNVSIFQSLTEEDPALLESHGRRRRYDKNFIAVQEGDEGSSMFVILTGRVSVYTANADGKRLWLRDMVAGDYFGEYALLDDSPRSATIHTAEPSEFLEISRDAVLQTFLDTHTGADRQQLRTLIRRSRGEGSGASKASKRLFQVLKAAAPRPEDG